MPDFLTQWALASDAMRITVIGVGFWLFALWALVMELRRNKTRSIERLENVGWVPWTPIFLTCAMIGGGCLVMGLPVLFAGP